MMDAIVTKPVLRGVIFDCDGEPSDDNNNPYQETYDFDDADGAFIDSEEAYDNHDWNAAD